MKTILVLTDYSDVSENAVHYAMKMVGYLKAKVILMHVFHIPVPTNEMPILISYNSHCTHCAEVCRECKDTCNSIAA